MKSAHDLVAAARSRIDEVDLPQADRQHPLLRWRREAGLGRPEPMPTTDAEWLEEEKKRLGD